MTFGGRATGSGRAGEGAGTAWPGAAAAAVLTVLAAAGCAHRPAPAGAAGDPPARFEFGRDTFAFPNLVRAEHPALRDAFANYCLLMAKAANQFFRFARFDAAAPPVSRAEYARRVAAVLRRAPWEPPAPVAERVVIPGYPSLHDFSRAEEDLVKAALGSNLLSMVHWRTWRVGVDFPPSHQEALAQDLAAEVGGGRPAAVMITNFPHRDLLNHAVLVYDRRPSGDGTEFLAYDPNDAGSPLALHFDRATRSFWVGPLTYSPAGRIRAFRLYTSPLF